MTARIYRPSRTATQSGMGRTRHWVLEFEPALPRGVDPLTGWTSSADMDSQVSLRFNSLEEAVSYAKRQGWAFHIDQPPPQRRILKAYADNFRPGRPVPWTH